MRYAPGVAAIIALAGYIASGPMTVEIMKMVDTQCVTTTVRLACAYSPQHRWAWEPYLALAMVSAAGLLAARTIWREASPMMLISVFSAIAIGACIYDSILQLPAIEEAKLSNDTFDTLRFAVLASLLMTIGIARGAPAPLWATLIASIASYTACALAMAVYSIISMPYLGATRMMLLFLVYTMVGFGLHIMAVGWLTTQMRMKMSRSDDA